MISFSTDWPQVIGLVLGVVLPLLVAIVTKTSTNSNIKAILLAAMALVTNILTGIEHALVTHTAFNAGSALVLGIGTFAIAVATHVGFWTPTRVAAILQRDVGRKDKPPIIPPVHLDDDNTDGDAYEGKHIAQ